MSPFFRFLSGFSILTCSVASCSGSQFTGGSTTTGGGGGSDVGGAGTQAGTNVNTGVGGTPGAGGNGTGGNGTGGNGTSGTNLAGSGGQHTGGNAGSSGGGGSTVADAGRDAGLCPSALPANGSPCTSPGLSCSYGDCCPSFATCMNGTWQIALAKCPAPTCPDQPPVNGSSCACFGPLACSYDACSMTQQQTDATCENQKWKAATYGCENACGSEDCGAGQVCLVKGGQKHCVLNPCLPQRLACACATSLCPAANICTVSSAVITCQ